MGCEDNEKAASRAIAQAAAHGEPVREIASERSVFFHQPRGGDPKKSEKKRALKEALALVVPGYAELLPGELQVYLRPGGGESDAYAFKRRSGDRVQVALFLADDVVTYRPIDRRASGPAARGGRGTSARRVADQVYDYYKSTWTVDASKRAATANVLHLFGHVLHQLGAWDDYASCVTELDVIAEGRGAPREAIKAEHELVLAIGTKQVSAAAGTLAARGLLDFAAESFVGWMVGLPLSEDVLLCQLGIGGPVPPETIRHVRGERAWPYPVEP